MSRATHRPAEAGAEPAPRQHPRPGRRGQWVLIVHWDSAGMSTAMWQGSRLGVWQACWFMKLVERVLACDTQFRYETRRL